MTTKKMTFGLVSEEKRPIAGKAWTNTGGIAIYDIVNEYHETYVLWKWDYGGSKKERLHKSKVYTEGERPYFKVNGRREFLDEYMKL